MKSNLGLKSGPKKTFLRKIIKQQVYMQQSSTKLQKNVSSKRIIQSTKQWLLNGERKKEKEKA